MVAILLGDNANICKPYSSITTSTFKLPKESNQLVQNVDIEQVVNDYYNEKDVDKDADGFEVGFLDCWYKRIKEVKREEAEKMRRLKRRRRRSSSISSSSSSSTSSSSSSDSGDNRRRKSRRSRSRSLQKEIPSFTHRTSFAPVVAGNVCRISEY